MRGLLLKDFYMFQEMKNFVGIVLAVSLVMVLTDTGSGSFIVSYLTFIVTMMTLSTITQDENGQAIQFLLTLPIMRRDYVKEKYLLALLVSGLGWIFSVVFSVAIHAVRSRGDMSWELIWESLIYIPILLLVLGVMLPTQFKFGGEKGRVALIAIVVVGIGMAMTVSECLKALSVDMGGWVRFLETYKYSCYLACLLFFMGVLWGSYRLSVRIIEGKQY